jgi:hypothetical protein
MAAEIPVGFKQGDVDTRLGLCQPVCARQPRNPRSDYRNLHDVAPCVFVLLSVSGIFFCAVKRPASLLDGQGDLRNIHCAGCKARQLMSMPWQRFVHYKTQNSSMINHVANR